MKKLMLAIITLLAGCFFMNSVNAVSCSNKIKVHIFWGDGCPHCEAAMEYYSSIEEEYKDCFSLVKHEVWKNETNANLMKKVGSFLGKDVTGVPFTVIGEQYLSGFDETKSPDMITKAIVEEANNKDYIDVVEKVEKEINNTETKTSNKSDTIVTLAIIIIALGGVAALVVTSKSGK